MNMLIEAKPPIRPSSTVKIFQAAYILYLLALIFPLLALAGLIFTYVFRRDAEAYLQSHAQFLIRTFWIGLVYSVIAGALCFILIGFLLLFIIAIWWLIRLTIGLKALLEHRAIEHPNRWWI